MVDHPEGTCLLADYFPGMVFSLRGKVFRRCGVRGVAALGASPVGVGMSMPLCCDPDDFCPTYSGPLRLVITSFNGNKIITTGGGGALFSDDPVGCHNCERLYGQGLSLPCSVGLSRPQQSLVIERLTQSVSKSS